MQRLPLVLLVSVVVGCGKPAELTRENARALVEASETFRAPLDPGIVFTDTTFRPGPNTRREVLKVEALTIKDDGPFGAAGQTATLTFSYRWIEGPLAGHTYRSKARLNSAGGTWKVYEDYLQKELFRAERGED